MINIEQIESEFKVFFGDKENEHTLLARMHPLIAEVKRLRRELRKAKHWVKDYFIDKNGDYKDVGGKISYYDFMREVERIE